MDVVGDGVIFRGQAEGVPADGVKDVVALHPALPGDDVKGRVAARVPHVQPRARGVGELNQAVILGLAGVQNGLESLLLFPDGLPLGLDSFGIVLR